MIVRRLNDVDQSDQAGLIMEETSRSADELIKRVSV